mmetsp:Transcript_5981/g.10056  ORF Transcript_5981/g.10056 Transcript_5981/m.10056 type:complete len:237 (+) Transcript_5981:583-1293(+)
MCPGPRRLSPGGLACAALKRGSSRRSCSTCPRSTALARSAIDSGAGLRPSCRSRAPSHSAPRRSGCSRWSTPHSLGLRKASRLGPRQSRTRWPETCRGTAAPRPDRCLPGCRRRHCRRNQKGKEGEVPRHAAYRNSFWPGASGIRDGRRLGGCCPTGQGHEGGGGEESQARWESNHGRRQKGGRSARRGKRCRGDRSRRRRGPGQGAVGAHESGGAPGCGGAVEDCVGAQLQRNSG